MVNFALTRYVGVARDDLDTALSDLETQLETVDNGKTIYIAKVMEIGNGKFFQAYALYAT